MQKFVAALVIAGLPSGTWWSNTLNVQVCP